MPTKIEFSIFIPGQEENVMDLNYVGKAEVFATAKNVEWSESYSKKEKIYMYVLGQKGLPKH